jgi:hypothetical protein
MHIISLIVFWIAVIIFFWALVHGAEKAERARKERLKCMMNHPAGRRASIGPSLFGETEENFQKRYQTIIQPWHLEGD